ncbi:hypothetical protein MKW94_021200 [Papaver nudicaule]|uniref:HXXXD-type acyl-transferase family protein n=1 Tax=Papaver nudicaule TaxID=74823 RepID=A0AA42B2F2_PAPNU|nr:hypothetical protein [Papaver nudicaule]
MFRLLTFDLPHHHHRATLEKETKVRQISSHKVLPTCNTNTDHNQRIELNHTDLRSLRRLYIQRGLLFDRRWKQEEMKQVISQLKSSLSRTLDYFFPLAGRMTITQHDDATFSAYINCNSAGAEFIHAEADVTLADILQPTYVPHIVYSFFTMDNVPNYDGSKPLLSIKVTELIDGLFIGCSINHAVCDGTSFWHFMNSWSEICRGGGGLTNHISQPPSFERRCLAGTELPIRFPFPAHELFTKPYYPPPLEQRIFHFTPESIANIKAKAISTSHEINAHKISSLQALLAHFWIAVTKARRLDPDEETNVQIAIGNRARMDPPLPDFYFGSSVLTGIATAKAGQLVDEGLGWGASLLNQVITSHDVQGVQRYWENWFKKPVLQSTHDLISTTNLRTGSSPSFNIYGNDFGWGRPLAMRCGRTYKYEGKLSIDPGPVQGYTCIDAYLPIEIFRALDNDPVFMDQAITHLPPFPRV